MNEDFYNSFPCVLKQALKQETICFPSNMAQKFTSFIAYRKIDRNFGEDIIIHKNDFLSQIELKEQGKKIRPVPDNKCINSYSCSLNTDISILKTVLKLPRINKYIIKGNVSAKYGVMAINDKTKHISWWLYENADPSQDFEVIENE